MNKELHKISGQSVFTSNSFSIGGHFPRFVVDGVERLIEISGGGTLDSVGYWGGRGS